MNANANMLSSELKLKVKWLIIGRFLFAVLLLSSTVAIQISKDEFPTPEPFLELYMVILAMFFCSMIYTLIFRFYKKESHQWPVYVQIIVDTIFISNIVHLTGGYASFFSFLYLLAIIISSILLYKKGSLIIASICSLEYWLVIYLENIGWMQTVTIGLNMETVKTYSMEQIFFKFLITSSACFAVAILSGILSEQTKKSKKDLLDMENHVKRVEKMAYIGHMAANLAHEIKNPLASLAGSIQLLREEIPYDPSQDKLMQIILRETDRLSNLASNFLFFAKPPAGRQEKVLLDRIIDEILTLFEKDNNLNHNIFLNDELTENLYTLIDTTHLHQIVLNLLLNAAESIEGKGIIRVRMYPTKNNKVEIEISDNGRGISEENKELIFDPFFTTKPNGTGLGLSIIHSILETYDSRLNVDSEVGKGTTVSFQLKRI